MNRNWVVGLSAFVCVLGGAAVVSASRSSKTQAEPPNPPAYSVVSCLGHLEPKDGVIHIASPYVNGLPAIVEKVLVRDGEYVRAGQPLIVLQGVGQLEAQLDQKKALVRQAEQRAAQVRSGAKSGDIAAQQAEVARWQAEFENSSAEYERSRKLYEFQSISKAELDAKRTAKDINSRMLAQAQARLASVREVRPEDVKAADSELEAARAGVKLAEQELSAAIVRAPADGQVLNIFVRPGEQAGNDGLLNLGTTSQMYAIAEVYETDIARVRHGSHAVIRSKLFPGEMGGTVEDIGRSVGKNMVYASDPASFADSRVVEVKIRLEDSRKVASLVHGKVEVRFE